MRHFFWLLFLRGTLCQNVPLVIEPRLLKSWQGSCVLIPCEIKSSYPYVFHEFSLIWYLNPTFNKTLKDYFGTLLYKINTTAGCQETTDIPSFRGRVKYEGSLSGSDCSLKVSQLQKNDSGLYLARLYGSPRDPKKKWYKEAKVIVEESPPAPNFFPKTLKEDQMTELTCTMTYHCLDEPLSLTLGGLEGDRLAAQRRISQSRSLKTVLDFKPTWKDHQKRLTCSLNHLNGSQVSQSSMELDVKYTPKGVEVKAVPGQAVREGTKLALQCIYNSSNPEVYTYRWYKNHQQKYEWSTDKVEIYHVSQADSGSYKCRPYNDYESSSMSEDLTVDVQYPPKYTYLYQVPEGAIKEKSHVTLQCSSQGNPPIQNYTWYKDGKMLQHLTQKELVFSDIKPRNSGIYQCRVQNLLGSAESRHVTLNVQYTPKGVEVKAVPGQSVREGTKLALQCIYNSSNPGVSTYRWYKNHQQMYGRRTDKVEIYPVGQVDSGSYKCSPYNGFEPSSMSEDLTIDVQFAPKDVKIVQMPAGQIKEGSPVQLRCDVGSANPKELQYTWYKDQEPADLSGRMVSPASTLTIQNVTSKDSGIYECKVNNAVGFRHSLGLKLNVQYGPHSIQVSLDPMDTITEGKDVSLECTNDANPAANMYRWYWNRKVMPREFSKILFLRKVQVKHSGEYHCKASNIISEGASQPVKLAVYYSRTTMLKHTAIGFGAALAMIIMLGLLLYILRRGKKRVLPGTSRSQTVASVFMKKSKQGKLCNNNNQPSESMEDSLGFLSQGAEGAISYATIQFPPSVSKERTIYASINQTMPSSDPSNEAVVYSELRKPRLPSKGDTKAEYENVEDVKGEELHYSSLVHLTTRPKPIFDDSETDSESEESIQYATLKH